MGRKTRLGYLIMLGADSIALADSRPALADKRIEIIKKERIKKTGSA